MTDYVCGHSAHELSRLALQGKFFEAISRRAFERAGLVPGMRVLDVGCGAGDVTFLAAAIVGSAGYVVGVDRSAVAIETAVARAARLGIHHTLFRVGDVESLPLDSPVDAVVGRFVLMHQPDPAAFLRHAVRHLRPGGIVVMIESHMRAFASPVHSWPHSNLYDGIVCWMNAVIEASGAHTDMGLRLREVFLQAGLPEPELTLEARVEGGLDADIYRYTADSARSMLPAAERLGVAGVTEDDLATLESRLRDEVVANGRVLVSPLVVAAWCTTV